MKEITIDLIGVKDGENLLRKIGDVLVLGEWGMNWDALSDSMSYLDKGGVHGTSPIYEFPLSINFINCFELKKDDPESYSNLVEIFGGKHAQYRREGKELWTHFKDVPCPCCGLVSMAEEGDYDICTTCGWENDQSQNEDPDFAGGANKMSLNEAKAKFLKK